MGDYNRNITIISIPMGGDDVVLGVQWLQYLGIITFSFQQLFLKKFQGGKKLKLRGITGRPGNIINSNGMTNLLQK